MTEFSQIFLSLVIMILERVKVNRNVVIELFFLLEKAVY